MSWFDKLSKAAQKDYLAKHPNSKYGKKSKLPSRGKKETRVKLWGSNLPRGQQIRALRTEIKMMQDDLKEGLDPKATAVTKRMIQARRDKITKLGGKG